MATVTETDLQQVQDLIVSLHSETQKQIADGNAAMQKQIADLSLNTHKQIADLNARLNLGLAEVKGEIKELKAELKSVDIQINDMKNDQRAQDTRIFWLFILMTAVGIMGKLAKLY
jgi:hypothetical protein